MVRGRGRLLALIDLSAHCDSVAVSEASFLVMWYLLAKEPFMIPLGAKIIGLIGIRVLFCL